MIFKPSYFVTKYATVDTFFSCDLIDGNAIIAITNTNGIPRINHYIGDGVWQYVDSYVSGGVSRYSINEIGGLLYIVSTSSDLTIFRSTDGYVFETIFFDCSDDPKQDYYYTQEIITQNDHHSIVISQPNNSAIGCDPANFYYVGFDNSNGYWEKCENPVAYDIRKNDIPNVHGIVVFNKGFYKLDESGRYIRIGDTLDEDIEQELRSETSIAFAYEYSMTRTSDGVNFETLEIAENSISNVKFYRYDNCFWCTYISTSENNVIIYNFDYYTADCVEHYEHIFAKSNIVSNDIVRIAEDGTILFETKNDPWKMYVGRFDKNTKKLKIF